MIKIYIIIHYTYIIYTYNPNIFFYNFISNFFLFTFDLLGFFFFVELLKGKWNICGFIFLAIILSQSHWNCSKASSVWRRSNRKKGSCNFHNDYVQMNIPFFSFCFFFGHSYSHSKCFLFSFSGNSLNKSINVYTNLKSFTFFGGFWPQKKRKKNEIFSGGWLVKSCEWKSKKDRENSHRKQDCKWVN